MTPKTEKTNSEKSVEKDNKRSLYVGSRVTPEHKASIVSTAKKCDMTISDYILAIILGYEPKLALTKEQEALLLGFDELRAHLQNFSNALGNLSEQDKLIVFGNPTFMAAWKEANQKAIDAVNEFMEKFEHLNKFNFQDSRQPIKPSVL